MKDNPLTSLFSVKDSNVRSAVCDLFALGCYLYVQGHTSVGKKMCATAWRAAGAPNESKVIKQLATRASEFARACAPHAELIGFLKKNMPTSKE